MVVRITKIRQAMNAGAPPAAWDKFVAGGPPSSSSLPVDWELDGKFMAPISVAYPLLVLRVRRNGVPVLGIFTTTPVVALYALTQNSLYRIEPLPIDSESELDG